MAVSVDNRLNFNNPTEKHGEFMWWFFRTGPQGQGLMTRKVQCKALVKRVRVCFALKQRENENIENKF